MEKAKKQNLTPPPQQKRHDSNLIETCKPDVVNFILKLRLEIFNCSITKFCELMGWNDEKYYQQIINGYKDKNGYKKHKKPTIEYLFKGINYAVMNNKDISNKYDRIIDLIKLHILKK